MAKVDQTTTVARGERHQPALARVAAERTRAIRFGNIPADVIGLAKAHLLDQLASASRPRPCLATSR